MLAEAPLKSQMGKSIPTRYGVSPENGHLSDSGVAAKAPHYIWGRPWEIKEKLRVTLSHDPLRFSSRSVHKAFYDRVRNFKERVTPREELQDLATRLPEEKVQVLLGLAKALADGRAIVSF